MTLHVSTGAVVNEGLLPASVKIGMPHLSLAGLSESWLLKECGHRHWFLLAAAAGEPFPDFHDAAGNQVYAVFRAVRISGAWFEAVKENDDLNFSSTLLRISRTQFESRHVLTVCGIKVGEVEMISSFVKREIANVNRSVARVHLDAFPFAGDVEPSGLADLSAGFWNETWTEHNDFRRAQPQDHGHLVVRPNPSLDFNGARFLYFASFPALADQAEWALLDLPTSVTTTARDVFYYGNIEPGEKIDVRINGMRRVNNDIVHWCAMHRECDGSRLADIFTARRVVVEG